MLRPGADDDIFIFQNREIKMQQKYTMFFSISTCTHSCVQFFSYAAIQWLVMYMQCVPKSVLGN